MNALQKILATFDIEPAAFEAAEVDSVLKWVLPVPQAKRDAPSSLAMLLRIWDALRDKAEAGKVEGLAVTVEKSYVSPAGNYASVSVCMKWAGGFVAACIAGNTDRAKPRVFANGRQFFGSAVGRKVNGLCPLARMVNSL